MKEEERRGKQLRDHVHIWTREHTTYPKKLSKSHKSVRRETHTRESRL